MEMVLQRRDVETQLLQRPERQHTDHGVLQGHGVVLMVARGNAVEPQQITGDLEPDHLVAPVPR